jgi:copper chaperone CopZ
MKSLLHLFFILFMLATSLIIYDCEGDNSNNKPDMDSKKKSHSINHIVNFTVSGITCHSCITAIKSKLMVIKGINSTEVFLREKNNVSVSYDPKQVSIEKIIAAINETGREVIKKEDS